MSYLKFFLEANKRFLSQNVELFTTRVSERTLCGALMMAMNGVIRRRNRYFNYKGYFVDIEYNRNSGRVKTIINDDFRIIKINCDLILHSRGHNKWQDNLIALEMKKSNRPEKERQSDRERLIALTKDSDGVWSADGITLPEHVCGYVLGIYYEVNQRENEILLEFYKCGRKFSDSKINF
ncbi:hypothetical protein DesLBE_4672 [Desulfitobacterium sp. LBE]|nr:hypothetical protein DesLBE_4672 [Desulfitobacterium sp. LBE]